MIVIDTNVISELTRSVPDSRVVLWHELAVEPIATTVISAAELRSGLALMPIGRKKETLTQLVEAVLASAAAILPFEDSDSHEFAFIRTARKLIGRPISVSDAQIAAICRRRNLQLATRNVRDFEACGIRAVDPFA